MACTVGFMLANMSQNAMIPRTTQRLGYGSEHGAETRHALPHASLALLGIPNISEPATTSDLDLERYVEPRNRLQTPPIYPMLSLSPSIEVERLCDMLVSTINSQDFDFNGTEAREIARRVTPTWEAKFNNFASTITFAQQTAIWRKLASTSPSFGFKILDIFTTVRERTNTAAVLLRLEIHTGNVKVQGMCELKWKLAHGEWLFYYHTSMRGLCPEDVATTAVVDDGT